jgi:hypothetical protein
MYVGSITDHPEIYWAWAACIVGPVAYVLALIHAVMWKRASAAIGSVVSYTLRQPITLTNHACKTP